MRWQTSELRMKSVRYVGLAYIVIGLEKTKDKFPSLGKRGNAM